MSNQRADAAHRADALAALSRALDDGRLPVGEYDSRVAAIGSATYVPELAAQAQQFGWQPPSPSPAAAAPYGKIALVLGILSVPFAVCLVGLILGGLAIVYSVRAHETRFGPAMIGRVFGIIGVALSLAAGSALIYALTHSLGP